MFLASVSGTTLGLLAAVTVAICLGTFDYLSAHFGEKTSSFILTSYTYLMGVPVLGIIVLIQRKTASISNNSFLLFIGLLSAFALVVFMYGLSKGSIAIITPIAAVFTFIVPGIVSVISGDEINMLLGIGLLLAAVSIVFISMVKEDHAVQKNVKLSITTGSIAGIIFGIYFSAIGNVSSPIAWKVFLLQLTGFFGALIYAFINRQQFVNKKCITAAIVLSVLINIYQFIFAYATNYLSLVVVTIIVGFAPGLTIALAKILKKQMILPRQYFGYTLAAIALVFVTISMNS